MIETVEKKVHTDEEKWEAKIRGMWPQPKECLEVPEAQRSREVLSPRAMWDGTDLPTS